MEETTMHHVTLTNGHAVPALGLGTWRMGEATRAQAGEVAAIRHAIELGYRLFDTAEMYGEGGAETLLGRAVNEALRAGEVKRDEVFIVSKVYPHNASRAGTVAACERSLKRLGLAHVDLYLLHWPGSHPLADTVAAFEALKAQGRIRAWGVSNFDADDMAALWAQADGTHCVANQVYYSLAKRGIEFDLVPWQRKHRVATMAYCPIDQGTLARSAALRPLADRLNATPAQVALAWLIARGDVMAIPKAVQHTHLRDNFAAASLTLDAGALAEIDALFAPPRKKQPLAMS
jgi:diketogulonate reductase-like aldo/keto reductase